MSYTKYKNYTIWTIGSDRPFEFKGKMQSNLESPTWFFFLKEDGDTLSFRKQNIVAIKEGK